MTTVAADMVVVEVDTAVGEAMAAADTVGVAEAEDMVEAEVEELVAQVRVPAAPELLRAVRPPTAQTPLRVPPQIQAIRAVLPRQTAQPLRRG